MRINGSVTAGILCLCCPSLLAMMEEPVLLYCSDIVSDIRVCAEALPTQGAKAKIVSGAFGYADPRSVDIIWGECLGRRLLWPQRSNRVIVTDYTQLCESVFPSFAYMGTIEEAHWSQDCSSVHAVKAIKSGYDVWCTKKGQSFFVGNIRFSEDRRTVCITDGRGAMRCVLWNWGGGGLPTNESYLQDPSLKVDGIDRVLRAEVYNWGRFLDTVKAYGPRNSANTRYVKSFEEFVISSGYKLKK